MKLTNSHRDRDHLNGLLKSGKEPKATFQLSGFTSELADSLITEDYKGTVTSIDMKSGYCGWNNVQGTRMIAVNIDCITLD